MKIDDLIFLARTTDFKIGDEVIELGGGEFRATVVGIDFPYLYVRYDDEPRVHQIYHDYFRKLTKLEKALK